MVVVISDGVADMTQGLGSLAELGPESRRNEIVRIVTEQGQARVEALAEEFTVSKMTVHRDLDLLAKEGKVIRVRGGARTVPTQFLERDVTLRRVSQQPQKRALAREAMTMISDGDIVVLDDSSTVGTMMEFLNPEMQITIITHSLGTMRILADDFPGVTLVGLGGQYYSETDSFLSAHGESGTLRANTVFVSTTALRGGSICHPDAEAAAMKRSLIALGDRKVLLADSSKFEANGLYQIASLNEFDDIIVEAGLPPTHREQLRSFANLTVHDIVVDKI